MIRLRLGFCWKAQSRQFALITLAGVIALFTACSVGPNYVKPTAPVPESYKEIEGWKVAQPKDHLIRGAWWEIFNDSRLNELEEEVDISNQNVAAAEAQFRQARALVWAARAAYFPTATVGLGYTRSSKSTTLNPNPKIVTKRTTLNDFLLVGDISWEPDIWGKVRRSVEASRASAQASAADLESVRLLVQSELAQDYLQLRTLDAQKQLLDETVIAYQKNLELTNNRYQAGVASKADVALAETQLKTAQAQAIDVGVQRAQFEHAIALLIGKPPSLFSIPADPLNLTPPPIPVGIPSELLERRPDIAGSERRVASANAQIGVAVAAYYPTVTLSASGGFESANLSKWLKWPSRFWSVGPSISETVFDGGLRTAQTAVARAAYDANVAQYRETVLNGFVEVEDNLSALRILEEEAAVQDGAVKAGKESLAIALNQYKAGTINYLAVVVIQAALLNIERIAVDIMGRRMTASVLLVKALGGGWDVSTLPTAKELGRKDPKPPKATMSESSTSQSNDTKSVE